MITLCSTGLSSLLNCSRDSLAGFQEASCQLWAASMGRPTWQGTEGGLGKLKASDLQLQETEFYQQPCELGLEPEALKRAKFLFSAYEALKQKIQMSCAQTPDPHKLS